MIVLVDNSPLTDDDDDIKPDYMAQGNSKILSTWQAQNQPGLL
jgi:hypothetical protein